MLGLANINHDVVLSIPFSVWARTVVGERVNTATYVHSLSIDRLGLILSTLRNGHNVWHDARSDAGRE